MPQAPYVIHIEPTAPAKPPWGAPCNGCGVCCLIEPCPLGVLLSRRRRGACVALRWSPVDQIYRCGAIIMPQAVLNQRLPRLLWLLRRPLTWLLQRGAARWVADGVGCDCDVEAAPVETGTGHASAYDSRS